MEKYKDFSYMGVGTIGWIHQINLIDKKIKKNRQRKYSSSKKNEKKLIKKLLNIHKWAWWQSMQKQGAIKIINKLEVLIIKKAM